MSQLEFRDYTILSSSEWKGIEVYNSEGNVASLGNDTGDFRMTDVHYATADELDQIAAKLRELNGEPNTRALDERVRELRDWIGNLRKWLDDPAMLTQFSVYGSAGASMAFGILRTSIDTQFPELFPAELKEKLKESEDGD